MKENHTTNKNEKACHSINEGKKSRKVRNGGVPRT